MGNGPEQRKHVGCNGSNYGNDWNAVDSKRTRMQLSFCGRWYRHTVNVVCASTGNEEENISSVSAVNCRFLNWGKTARLLKVAPGRSLLLQLPQLNAKIICFVLVVLSISIIHNRSDAAAFLTNFYLCRIFKFYRNGSVRMVAGCNYPQSF